MTNIDGGRGQKMERAERLYQFYIRQMELGFQQFKDWDIYYRNQQGWFEQEMSAAIQRIKMKIGNAPLFCIYLCLFRSNYMFRNGNVCLYAYKKEYFLEKDPVCEEIDLKCLIQPLWNFEDELINQLRGYKNWLIKNDVQVLMQSEYVPLLLEALEWLMRQYIRKNREMFLENLKLEADFRVSVGEYQGRYKEVYITERLDDEGVNLEQLLQKHSDEEDLCCYKCYENAYACNLNFRGRYMIMSRFENGVFSGSDFSGCYAMESEWNNCKMEKTIWKNAKLFEASFCYSDLREADFRGAYLLDTDFTGAILTGAKFDSENQSMGNFNLKQAEEIIIE